MADSLLVLLSHRDDDAPFWRKVALAAGGSFEIAKNAEELQAKTKASSYPLIIWDWGAPHFLADKNWKANFLNCGKAIQAKFSPNQVYVLTEGSLNENLQAHAEVVGKSLRMYGSNIVRAYDATSEVFYTALLKSAFKKCPLELLQYFPESTKSQVITLKKAAHREAAVRAVESFLVKTNLDERMASKVSQAVEELLMNAIMNAYREAWGQDPKLTQIGYSPTGDFDDKHPVEIEIAVTGQYVGLAVRDYFGSLNPNIFIEHLIRPLHSSDYRIPKSEGASLGFYKIYSSGLSILLAYQDKVSTSAMLFFPNLKSHREFKSSFHFASCVRNK